MSRFLIALSVVAVLALGGAGASGAFSSGTDAGRTPMTMAGMTQMSMARARSTGSVRVELHQKVVKVQIRNFAFVPARVEVSPGTRVEWTNQDSDPHTVTTDKSGFSSQALNTGQSYARVMGKAGTITYHCQIHPFMHGTVLVEG